MFGISNRIAYDCQMVHAAGKGAQDRIGNVLGSSAWLNVDGDAASKWCPAEGDVVIALLERLAAAGVTDPSLYIITPFRVVAQGLRDRLKERGDLLWRLGVSDIDDWCRDRVGTIHTFQGKEADAVIAVLGAPNVSQQGARRWAAESPNILNVMVSRAKSRLYVVGSRGSWGNMGHARDLAVSLPVIQA
jgi:superfamily I DNA and/or RNA helicase